MVAAVSSLALSSGGPAAGRPSAGRHDLAASSRTLSAQQGAARPAGGGSRVGGAASSVPTPVPPGLGDSLPGAAQPGAATVAVPGPNRVSGSAPALPGPTPGRLPPPASSLPTPSDPRTSHTGPAPTPTRTPTRTPTPADPDGTLVWSDNFSGPAGAPPNPAMWKYNQGGSGWGNNELECYTDSTSNAATNGRGDLVITARYAPGHSCTGGAQSTTNNFTSARLSTEHLATMSYGRLRVRAMLPSASGVWPAIWAMGDDYDQIGWPYCGEMDVAEVTGKDPSTVYGTIHGPGSDGQPYDIGGTYALPSPAGSAFHVYGLDWTPSSITFSVDGVAYETIDRADVASKGSWVFDSKAFVLLNVAVGGNWPGSPSAYSQFPQQMTVDYVRVYR